MSVVRGAIYVVYCSTRELLHCSLSEIYPVVHVVHLKQYNQRQYKHVDAAVHKQFDTVPKITTTRLRCIVPCNDQLQNS